MLGISRLTLDDANEPRDGCSGCKIRHNGVCTYCGAQELALLNTLRSYKAFAPGQTIIAAGYETRFLGSVLEGVVALARTLPDGRRQTVGLMFPSDFLGRPMRPLAPFDAVALTPVQLCLFTRARFERLLREIPELEKRLLEMALDELDAVRDWMSVVGRKTAQEKIATFLTSLARRFAALDGKPPGDGLRFELPLSRAAIAEYLGLAFETVSREINVLRQAGVIELTDSRARTVHVPDYMALLDIASEDADGGMIDGASFAHPARHRATTDFPPAS
jgi:CRP/FNR family transcriptional regulator